MNYLIYGVMAIFAVTLLADVLVAGVKRLIITISGSETPIWAEKLIVVARRWGDM